MLAARTSHSPIEWNRKGPSVQSLLKLLHCFLLHMPFPLGGECVPKNRLFIYYAHFVRSGYLSLIMLHIFANIKSIRCRHFAEPYIDGVDCSVLQLLTHEQV